MTQPSIGRISPWTVGALLVFCIAASDYFERVFDLGSSYRIIALIALAAATIKLAMNTPSEMSKIGFRIPVAGFAFFLAYFAFWYERSFGQFDIGSIIFHSQLGFGNLEDKSITKRAARYFGLFLLLFLSTTYLFSKYRIWRRIDLSVAIIVTAMTPFWPLATGYANSYMVRSALLGEHRQIGKLAPSSDGKSKNLVIIYAESTERTFQELHSGQDVFRDMKSVASMGREVAGIIQVANTGWSIAGLVASQCGVPLQPHKTFYMNKITKRDLFMKNAMCLGDLLKSQNYQLTYMSGADLSFAGWDRFLKEHGYDEIIEFRNIGNKNIDYVNEWGIYDDTLLDLAEEKLEKLSSGTRPFVLSIATIGAHFPEGHPTKECIDRYGPIEIEPILYAIKCTGYHVRQFVEKAQSKGWLDNTIVVVMSDHLMMTSAVSDELEQHERMNFFAALGDTIEPGLLSKQSATFDVFPTLLELIGFEIPDRRAGLGTSLLSPEPSLVERLGVEAINGMITYDKELSAFLWDGIRPEQGESAAMAPVQAEN